MTITFNSKMLANPAAAIEDERWEFVYSQFLSLVDQDMRNDVQRMVSSIHGSGEGLRRWINEIAYHGRVLPEAVPKSLLNVYMSDPEALPLHDCSDCGLSVPVRPNRLYGSEGEPEEQYFPECPVCGGRTGLYCFWSNRLDNKSVRHSKPR